MALLGIITKLIRVLVDHALHKKGAQICLMQVFPQVLQPLNYAQFCTSPSSFWLEKFGFDIIAFKSLSTNSNYKWSSNEVPAQQKQVFK